MLRSAVISLTFIFGLSLSSLLAQSDEKIQTEANDALRAYSLSTLIVSVQGGSVILKGTVDSCRKRLLADEAVSRIHGVKTILLFGFGLQRVQLVNAPDWIRTDLWNAEGYADSPGEPNHEQMQSLVRKLLTERFGLAVHKEQREMPVYLLTVAKGGPRMTPTADDPNGPQSESDREDDGRAMMNARNLPAGQLASVLMRVFLDRPVLDKTGLAGHYDLELKWTQDDARAPTDGSALPGLFTAIEEQLGLKLEPAKAMADVLVIDKIERPGAN